MYFVLNISYVIVLMPNTDSRPRLRRLLPIKLAIPGIGIVLFAILLFVSLSIAAEPPVRILHRAKQLHSQGLLIEASDQYASYLRVAPDDLDTRWLLVELLVFLKRYEAAQSNLEFLRAKSPNDPRLKLFKLDKYTKREKKRVPFDHRTEKEFEEIIAKGNPKPEILLDYARYLTSTNHLPRAIEIYRMYLKQRPEDVTSRLNLAKIFSWTKGFDAGRAECQILLKQNPKNADALGVLGDIYAWSSQEETAITYYRQAQQFASNPGFYAEKIKRLLATPGYKEIDMMSRAKKDHTGKVALELAKLLLDQGREDEADSLVQVRLEYTSQDSEAINLSETIKVHREKRLTENRIRLNERLLTNPKDTLALLGLAQTLYQYPDSIMVASRIYVRYLNLRPSDNQARLEYANTLLWAGRWEEAEKELRSLSIVMKDNLDVQLGLADAMLRSSHDPSASERIYRLALMKKPDDITIKTGLGEALRMQGRYNEARQIFSEVLEADSTNKWISFILGYMDEDYGPLIHAAEKAVEAAPDDPDAIKRLAEYYLKSKRYRDAETSYRRLLNIEPNNPIALEIVHNLERRKLGWQFEQFNNTMFEMGTNPESAESHLLLADFLISEENYPEAIEQYKTVHQMKPDDRDIELQLADLYESNKQLSEAIEIYRRLATDFPNNYEYRYRLAQALLERGDNTAALQAFETANTMNPDAVETLLGIAELYQLKNETELAIEKYLAILSAHPENEPAKTALSDIKGSVIRGIQFSANQESDNGDYSTQAQEATIDLGLSIRNAYRIGYGQLKIKQKSVEYKAWQIFAETDIRLAKNFWNSSSYHQYQWEESYSPSYRTEFRYLWSDDKLGSNAELRVSGSKQDAIFDIGSEDSLRSMSKGLSSVVGGVHGLFSYWRFGLEGDYTYTDISDNNHRDWSWGELGYRLNPYLTVGARRESLRFTNPSQLYWSSKIYDTFGGWAQIKRSSTKLDFSAKGIVTKVFHTNSTERTVEAELEYKLKEWISIGGSYNAIATQHETGKYTSQGFTVTLNTSW